MRKIIALFLALAAFGFSADVASAKSNKVSLSASVAQVRNACSKVGGVFSVHNDGGGYGCRKNNCDGKGGNCQVECDNNNNCTGVTPARLLTASSPAQILTGGQGKAETTGSGTPTRTGILDGGLLNSGGAPGGNSPSAAGSPSTPSAPASAPQIR